MTATRRTQEVVGSDDVSFKMKVFWWRKKNILEMAMKNKDTYSSRHSNMGGGDWHERKLKKTIGERMSSGES